MKIDIWGDSIAKGVIFDESRGRYALCRDSCAAMLSRVVTVRNHAVMGQTSADGLSRLREAEIESGTVVAIEYGGNDCDLDWLAAAEHPETRQAGRVPIDRFAENMREMIRIARERGGIPVVVCPPPVLSERYFDRVSRDLNADRILEYLGDVEAIGRWQAGYADRVCAVARETEARIVDVRSCFLQCDQPEKLFCVDGIHPNADGHRAMFDAIAPLLTEIHEIIA